MQSWTARPGVPNRRRVTAGAKIGRILREQGKAEDVLSSVDPRRTAAIGPESFVHSKHGAGW
jgi:hypothetical protein